LLLFCLSSFCILCSMLPMYRNLSILAVVTIRFIRLGIVFICRRFFLHRSILSYWLFRQCDIYCFLPYLYSR
jgi:hypothetical protein